MKVEGLVRTDPKTCVERVEAVFDTFDLGAVSISMKDKFSDFLSGP